MQKSISRQHRDACRIRLRIPARAISGKIETFGEAQIHQQMFARGIFVCDFALLDDAVPIARDILAPAFRQFFGESRCACRSSRAGHARRGRRPHNRHSASREDCAGFRAGARMIGNLVSGTARGFRHFLRDFVERCGVVVFGNFQRAGACSVANGVAGSMVS